MISNSVSAIWAAVAGGLGNHLWQLTLFACAAGLLTLTLRKNQARARYWLWLTASIKFLIPFSLLIGMGSNLGWPRISGASQAGVYVAMAQASLPFTDSIALQPAIPAAMAIGQTTQPTGLESLVHFLPMALMVVWLCGFAVVLFRWMEQWRRVSAAVRDAEPLCEGREVEMLRRLERTEIGDARKGIEMVASPESMEPGVFGIVRPVLVWPEGISERLDDAHLEAVLAHELWHVRRRDNLTASIHMVVQATFWFHPMVWWLGTRLVEERERACDEEVLRLCQRPQVYAESILKVCEFCVESPLPCVSGVTGADLKKRILHIMTEHVARKLNFSRKLLLGVAGVMAIAVPVMVGAMNAPMSLAQATAPVRAMRARAALLVQTAAPMVAAVEPEPAVALQAQAPAPSPAPSAPTPAPTHEHGDIAGDWQGTLQGQPPLRIILKISKANKGWSAKMYSIDQGARAINASSIALDGSTFKCSVDQIGGSYQGMLSADGSSITGSWTQGPNPLPLTLMRATKETAWEIPAPPPPPKPMAADADPSFEVATIKPHNPDQPGKGFRINGRTFSTINTSLDDLVEFAYDVHAKQIVGAPDWIDKDAYDITGVPDGDGQPNNKQWKTMLQKLLAERFKLAFHHDKRDLSVFALTVGKDGPINLTKNESVSDGHSLFFGPTPGGIMLPARNTTMADFAGVMQAAVLDRPVVDQTGLTGKFDFTLKWEPDDSQFGGHVPPASASSDLQPNLFTAIQQQIGLKLDAVKTPVDVLVIDHVDKPSAN
jgi:uncharacterized protein (TIGR03435 family)